MPRPRALHLQGAAHFLGGEGAAMQTETMTVLLGGETVVENPRKIFGRDANAIVDDGQLDAVVGLLDAHGQLFIRTTGVVAGVFGVTDQIDENLEHFVALNGHKAFSF